MQFKKHHPDPVIEALRVRIRRDGLDLVAYDLHVSSSWIEVLAAGRRPMSRYIANKLGFEQIITWKKVEKI